METKLTKVSNILSSLIRYPICFWFWSKGNFKPFLCWLYFWPISSSDKF